jgi:hypothetical protein
MIAACRIGLCLFAIVAVTTLLAAQEVRPWHVENRIEGPDGKKSIDVSGIACSETEGLPRSCLVIDDNSQYAQFVTVRDGELIAGKSIRLIDDVLEKDGKKNKSEPLELDGEGVAFNDGFYYVIGSHGRPRNAAKLSGREIAATIAARSQIVRFRASDETNAVPERSAGLAKIIAGEPAFAAVIDNNLHDNGITIEGVAIRHGQLYSGFRGPVLGERAIVLSAPLDGLFGGRQPAHRLFRLPLDGLGVRDLAVYRDKILILAGPMRNGPGRYAVFSWNGDSEDVRLLGNLDGLSDDEGKRKPEALLPLDKTASGRLRVLILSDGPKEGAPTPVEIDAPD